MRVTQKQRQREWEEAVEIYKGLNLRQQKNLLWLLSDKIDIPHAFNDGCIRDLEVNNVVINGTRLGIITDQFANHCENIEKK